MDAASAHQMPSRLQNIVTTPSACGPSQFNKIRSMECVQARKMDARAAIHICLSLENSFKFHGGPTCLTQQFHIRKFTTFFLFASSNRRHTHTHTVQILLCKSFCFSHQQRQIFIVVLSHHDRVAFLMGTRYLAANMPIGIHNANQFCKQQFFGKKFSWHF